MKCPACSTVMFVVEYDGVELDACPGCAGVWFDRGELDLVLGGDQPVPVEAAVSDEARRRCPLCRKKMDKVNIGPGRRVLVDVCGNECGLYFDRGELAELTADLGQDGWLIPAGVREFLGRMFPGPESVT